MPKCAATTVKGSPCKNLAVDGSAHCHVHAKKASSKTSTKKISKPTTKKTAPTAKQPVLITPKQVQTLALKVDDCLCMDTVFPLISKVVYAICKKCEFMYDENIDHIMTTLLGLESKKIIAYGKNLAQHRKLKTVFDHKLIHSQFFKDSDGTQILTVGEAIKFTGMLEYIVIQLITAVAAEARARYALPQYDYTLTVDDVWYARLHDDDINKIFEGFKIYNLCS